MLIYKRNTYRESVFILYIIQLWGKAKKEMAIFPIYKTTI